MRTLLANLSRTISAVVIIMTFLAYLCPHINPESFPWLSFFGTAFPWFFGFNVILFLLWAWRRNRFAFYHLGILLFGWSHVQANFGMKFSHDKVPENAVCIASQNIGAIYAGQKRITDVYREKRVAAYAKFLQENGYPDILCTQETGFKFYPALAHKLNYPYTFNLKKGTVIYSRFPMESGGEIPFQKTGNSTIWVDIRLNNRLLRVYNVHLQSNKVSTETEKVLEEGELDEEKTWDKIGGILDKVGGATRTRAQQAFLLKQHIEKCPHAAVICGDFNDTPNSFVYQLLSRTMNDSFITNGNGFGTTYGGILPFLRIDYILTDPALKIFDFKTVRGDLSDHFMIFAEVGF